MIKVFICVIGKIVYDAFRYGVEIPKGAKTIHQERAYTSPIWYTPSGK